MMPASEEHLDRSKTQPEESFLRWAIPLLENRKALVMAPILTAIFAVAVTLILPKKYTSSFSFTPVQSDAAAGALAGLAGQIGLSLPSSDLSASPDFFAKVLRTDDILIRIATRRYTVPLERDTLRGTFLELYEIEESDYGKSLSKALEVLSERIITIGFDRNTSIVSVEVQTKWRELSMQIATALLQNLHNYNIRSRQYQAGSEEQFLRLRLDTAGAELRAAENSLQNFLQANRSYQTDPVLAFEYSRRERELTLKQSVYSTLVQSYEAARLAAVRNTPSLKLVNEAKPALRFDRRRTLTKAALAYFAALVLTLAWISTKSTMDTVARATPDDSRRFRMLLDQSLLDVKRLFIPRQTGSSDTSRPK